MHGLTGGSWKRSALAMDTEKNSPAGNRWAPTAPGPTVGIRHRASSRPSVWVTAWLATGVLPELRPSFPCPG
jgi:hypothetical protein